MADKRMNDFMLSDDAEYVYAEAENGMQVKIKKSDLLKTMFQVRGVINGGTDFNTIITSGIYQYFAEAGSVLNGPNLSRIVLLCFQAYGHIAQVAFSVDPGVTSIKYRGSWNSGSNWNIWKSITLI
ncbi:pyocin knob domain-containing protein [Bacteroides fragilis]